MIWRRSEKNEGRCRRRREEEEEGEKEEETGCALDCCFASPDVALQQRAGLSPPHTSRPARTPNYFFIIFRQNNRPGPCAKLFPGGLLGLKEIGSKRHRQEKVAKIHIDHNVALIGIEPVI